MWLCQGLLLPSCILWPASKVVQRASSSCWGEGEGCRYISTKYKFSVQQPFSGVFVFRIAKMQWLQIVENLDYRWYYFEIELWFRPDWLTLIQWDVVFFKLCCMVIPDSETVCYGDIVRWLNLLQVSHYISWEPSCQIKIFESFMDVVKASSRKTKQRSHLL